MTSILTPPANGPWDWRFRIFGFPVRVQPWFWLCILILGANQEPGEVVIWTAVCFVSILLHELGHLAAFRAFGEDGEALLYFGGGMAIPWHSVRRSTPAQVLISLAGPAACFCLAAAVLLAAAAAGATTYLSFHALIPSVHALLPRPEGPSSGRAYLYWNVLLNDLLWVNLYWGLVNLLPIYPLDGGNVSKALFERYSRAGGRRTFLLLSACTAAAVAALVLFSGSIYMGCFFALLAVGSAQMLESERPAGQPY